MPVGPRHLLRFGPFVFDPECGQIRKNSTGLKLQGQPIQILQILLERPGEVVTREELRQRLWSSDTFVDFDHSLNTAIKKLRQALGDDAETPQYIETIPKRGYRFVSEVTREGAGANSASTSPPVVDKTVEKIAVTLADAALSASQKPRRLRFWMVLALSVPGLLMVAAVIYRATKPLPAPHIVAMHDLTRTGFLKQPSRLMTDGHSIYFQEIRPSGVVTMQVSVNGGDVAQVNVLDKAMDLDYSFLQDIKSDRSELLYTIRSPRANRADAWTQPLPTGPPRMLLRDVSWPIWTPDGRGMLFVRNNNKDLYRANSDGTNAHKLATFPSINDPAISPDGRRIRFGSIGPPQYSIWEAGSDGSNPHPILLEHRNMSGGTWSSDGKYYFFRSWDGTLHNLWGVREDRPWFTFKKPAPVQLTFGPFQAGVPAISNDGKRLYSILTEPHGKLSVYDPKLREYVPYLGGISAFFVDFSRDGQWITYSSYPEGILWSSRIDGAQRRQLTAPPFDAEISPRWSPDGRSIVFVDVSGGDRRHIAEAERIYVIRADGGEPLLLPTGPEPAFHDPTWSPDSNAIAYGVGGMFQGQFRGIRILNLRTGKWETVRGSEKFFTPRWSPDGKHLVALSLDAAKLILFSFATQQWEELASGKALTFPSWSRDSKRVLFADGDALFWVTIANHTKQKIVNVDASRPITPNPWYGLGPDDQPMSTRDITAEEIYAFDLEYK